MERARTLEQTRSIGVSNYSVSELEELARTVKDSPPVVNQVQFSPFEYRRGLLRDCDERGIVLEAYSPLGTGRHLTDPEVGQIASDVGVSPAQVLLRWCVQRRIPVIPKSTHRERIATNTSIFDLELSESQMAALDALDRTSGTERARGRRWW